MKGTKTKEIGDSARVGWISPRWLGSFPLSAKTRKMITERTLWRERLVRPQEGDFVKLREGPDGLRRIGQAEPYLDFVRLTGPVNPGAQVGDGLAPYMDPAGFGEFSGLLWEKIPVADLRDSGVTREGWFWVYRDNIWERGNMIEFPVHVRVWKVVSS